MADAIRGEEKGVNYLDNPNLILIHSRCFGCIFLPKTPALLLLVHQVSATKGFACPPMQAGFGGVPSPSDHQAFVPGDRINPRRHMKGDESLTRIICHEIMEV